MSLILLILGLLLFVGLVIVHEFGHFWTARRAKVEVEEFGIGFPPRAKVLKKRKGTLYTLNWLPLGGFVKLKGEHDADHEPGSFGAASLRAKIAIMVAGVVMNLVTAFILLTAVAWIGMPQLIENQFTLNSDTKVTKQEVRVGYVEPDSPAAQAGLKVPDRLVAIGPSRAEKPITDAKNLPAVTEQFAGEKVIITYERDGSRRQASTSIRTEKEVNASKKTSDPKGYLGISPSEYVMQRSTWSAPIVAGGLIKQFTVETFKGLGHALSGLFRGDTAQATEQVSGPVGVFVVLRDGSLLGFQFILLVIAIISLTLAIMNILPIPALDGGRLFVTLFFHLLRKPLTKRTEDMIHGSGFVVLMVLFLLITIVDVRRFF
jgi:regulator of sigma E protease